MKKAVFILLASIVMIGCISLKKGPHKAYNEITKHDVTFDAIIVPGIPYQGQQWDSVMKARVIWSWILYKNGVTKNIIYSGSAVYTKYYEAKIMGLYAQELGIPKEHIYYDTLARHSTENAFYSYLVAKENGFKTVALTTDPFQSALLKGFTKQRLGTQIYHMPFVIDSLKKYNNIEPTINPTSAIKENFVSITEQEKPFKRFMGTMGADINWDGYKGKVLPPL